MSLPKGTRLGPYQIESLLGSGGMGQVYRALDTRLGRAVAVKVLPQAVAGDQEHSERFAREARAVASLSHPNICALFDVGTQDDTQYLVMEMLEGDTLADRVAQGPLPVSEALRLAAQIADAVAAAHTRGIIHRDLKSANVVLTANGAKVLDFGLAKFLESDSESTAGSDMPTQLATDKHAVMGTAHYMSPEQARGLPLDHRTDAWSFGIVLYEMLVGAWPYQGETVTDILSAILRDDIDLGPLPSAVSPAVRDLLVQLTRHDVEARLGDLAKAAAILRVGLTVDSGSPVVEAPTDDFSIVVLPFANNSPDPDNEYFSDGLTEEVIADLSKIGALRVISRTTAMRLKGMEQDLRSVATELKVRYVLEGSVRKAGNNLRITTQLIDTRTDSTVWSDKYGGTMDDVFEIQEQVSRAIADALALKLTPEENQSLAVSRVNPYAYDVFLRARRDIWNWGKEGLDRALKELEHALEIVGDDVLLYRGLGMVNWQYVNSGLSGDPAYLDKAEVYTRKILEMDPDSPHAAALLGHLAVQRGNVHEWIRQFRIAVAGDPYDSDNLLWLALGWIWVGYPENTQPHIDTLLSIDPLFDLLQFAQGSMKFHEGDFEGSLAHIDRYWELSPGHPALPMIFVQFAASAGQVERGVEFMDTHGPSPEDHPLARLGHILKFAVLGDEAAATALINPEFEEIIWGDFQYTHFMAQAHALLNHKQEAMRWLTRAVDRGFLHFPYLSKIDPLLENLRSEPEFTELMERVKAEWEQFEAIVDRPDGP